MARIRSIHPGFFTHEGVVSCSPLARLLYVGLWCEADCQGIFEWRPVQLKMRLLPMDVADIAALLQELVDQDLVRAFERGGAKYGAVGNFRHFQRPKKPTATHPMPSEFRTYVALDAASSEQDDVKEDEFPHQYPTSTPPEGENARMEGREGEQEEGGKGREGDAASKPRPKHALSKNWTPNDIDRAFAASHGLSPSVTALMAERFANHAEQTGRKCSNWAAAWRNWVLKDVKEQADKGGGRSAAYGPKVW